MLPPFCARIADTEGESLRPLLAGVVALLA